MHTPNTKRIAHALGVVSDPETFIKTPALIQDAWATLKQARGQEVNFAKLGTPAYQVDQDARTRLQKPAQQNTCAARTHGDDAA